MFEEMIYGLKNNKMVLMKSFPSLVKKNLYEELKSLISLSSFISFISCNVGVRQGENLSPVLFPFPALEIFF